MHSHRSCNVKVCHHLCAHKRSANEQQITGRICFLYWQRALRCFATKISTLRRLAFKTIRRMKNRECKEVFCHNISLKSLSDTRNVFNTSASNVHWASAAASPHPSRNSTQLWCASCARASWGTGKSESSLEANINSYLRFDEGLMRCVDRDVHNLRDHTKYERVRLCIYLH